MARKGLSDPVRLWRLRAAKLTLAEHVFLQIKRCSRPRHDDRYARYPHFASGTPIGGKHTLRGSSWMRASQCGRGPPAVTQSGSALTFARSVWRSLSRRWALLQRCLLRVCRLQYRRDSSCPRSQCVRLSRFTRKRGNEMPNTLVKATMLIG